MNIRNTAYKSGVGGTGRGGFAALAEDYAAGRRGRAAKWLWRAAAAVFVAAVVVFLCSCAEGARTRVAPAETTIIRITPPAAAPSKSEEKSFQREGREGREENTAPPPTSRSSRPSRSILFEAVAACVLCAQDGGAQPTLRVKVGDRVIEYPAGSGLEIVTSTGNGVETDSAEAAANIAATAPDAHLGGVGGGADAQGGALKFMVKLTGKSQGGAVLFWIGGLAVITGFAGLGLKRWLLGAALIVGGGVVIACAVMAERAPWVFIAAGVVVFAIFGVVLYEAWRHGRLSFATTAIAKGIETLGQETRDVARDAIGTAAAKMGKPNLVKAEIERIKRRVGI